MEKQEGQNWETRMSNKIYKYWEGRIQVTKLEGKKWDKKLKKKKKAIYMKQKDPSSKSKNSLLLQLWSHEIGAYVFCFFKREWLM